MICFPWSSAHPIRSGSWRRIEYGAPPRPLKPVLILYFPLFTAVCLAAVFARRRRPRAARALSRVALLLSVLPYLLHLHYTWGWVTQFGDPQPRIGTYPGVQAYAASSLGTALLLLVAGGLLERRFPLLMAFVPAALWLLYWYVCLPLVFWRAPEFAPLDNVPLAWLFASSAYATVMLAGSAWIGLRRAPPIEGASSCER